MTQRLAINNLENLQPLTAEDLIAIQGSLSLIDEPIAVEADQPDNQPPEAPTSEALFYPLPPYPPKPVPHPKPYEPWPPYYPCSPFPTKDGRLPWCAVIL
ncbi:MAG: hypothetical protein F6J97_20635 [Leptolyngbya sp. SIO4C1]|nr:hypothetical protein [Leptolyngbya sp. SIO4C1]